MEPSGSPPDSTESLVDMNRMNGLGDGVFAFALTLLALDLRLPEGAPVSALPENLLQLAPKFLVFLVSFVVIGGGWGAHQRMLKQIRRGDGLLVWFNLFCLLFVALLPASAALLGRYPTAFLAITVFALDVALIQLASLWLWRHASSQGLINPRLDPRVVRSIARRLWLSTVIFVLSIPLALLSIWITYLFWAGLFLLLFTTDWLAWQQAARVQQTRFPLEGVQRARIVIQHHGGRMRIASGAERDILLEGVFGGVLESEVDRSEEAATIHLREPKRRGLLSYRYPWSWGTETALDWRLKLNDKIPLSLEIEVTAGDLTLELEGLQVTDLTARLNTSNTHIALPDRDGTTRVHLEAHTVRLSIRVPPGVAADLYNEMNVGAVEGDLERFAIIEEGRHWRSEGYASAARRADIRIVGEVSEVRVG